MKCAYFNCKEPATAGFKGCSKEHTYLINQMVGQVKKCQNLEGTWLEFMIGLKQASVGEIIHYSELV